MAWLQYVEIASYSVAFGLMVTEFISNLTRYRKFIVVFLILGALSGAILLGIEITTLRSSGQVPVGFSHFIRLLSLVLVGSALYLFWKRKFLSVTALVVSVAFVSTLFAALARLEAEAVLVDSSTNMFLAHVMVLLGATSSYILATIGGVVYVAVHHQLKAKRLGGWLEKLPALDSLDRMIVGGLVLGFVFLTVGMGTGIYLAHIRWVDNWAGDPKLVASSAAWIWYALLLVVRYQIGWRGKRFLGLLGIGLVLLFLTLVASMNGGLG